MIYILKRLYFIENMNRINLNYHVGLKMTSIYKIVVAVVFFAIVTNLINLGAFYKGNSIELNGVALQAETEIGRIYNKLNFPMKIIEDLFKGEKGFASGEDTAAATNNQYAVVPVQLKRTATEMSKKGSFIPASEMRVLQPKAPDIGKNGVLNYLLSNESVRTLLLILILMSILPRGIPVKIKSFKNIIFAFPVFIFNKVGIFHFYVECKHGGSNESNY